MMPKLTPRAVPQRAPGVVANRFGQDFVVLDGAGQMLRGLNATAARVFELMDGTSDIQTIAGRISKEFGVPGEQVAADVLAFIQTMCERGLATVRPPTRRS
jgi:pyrroloquinoline quinone biosynthesis protein D